MRSSSQVTVRIRPSGAKSVSILSCGVSDFQILHDAGDQLLGVADRFRDDLDIHSRLAGSAGALAIDAVLAHQHQRIGEHVERNGKLASWLPHHELVLLQFFAALFEYAHIYALV